MLATTTPLYPLEGYLLSLAFSYLFMFCVCVSSFGGARYYLRYTTLYGFGCSPVTGLVLVSVPE